MLKQTQLFRLDENICFFNCSQQKRTIFPILHSNPCIIPMAHNASSPLPPLKCEAKPQNPVFDPHGLDPNLLQTIAYDALVWTSLRGLLVGDRASQKSGTIPGVGLVHAPISLLPMPFPERHFQQACEVAPIFNELVDRVSLDSKFIQDSLFRTKKVDAFTSKLLDIHAKMLDMNNKEDIRLGLHRSDYMLDEQTNLLLQIELNTISSSFPGLSCLVSDLHRSLLHQFKQHLALDPDRIPENDSGNQFVEAFHKAWSEYNNPRSVFPTRLCFYEFLKVIEEIANQEMMRRAVVMVVVQIEERNISIRKTLAEIDAQGELLSDGTLVVDGEVVAVAYFRAGYAPTDYPSESEWSARLLIEQSCAIKCPSIAYHLAGTKKIQQELAKPNQLERFLENKDDIAKVRKCFAGLWSLEASDIVKDAIERPGLYVMKPQREGGGNNIYGDDVRIALQEMQKKGTEEDAAYILMQRIFPTISPAILMREGISHKEQVLSELGIYSTYLRKR
ncbi:Glutathione synthetase [Orobanche minor]